ncbi:hypothetical protein FHT82_000459 [Rhizobium sp. BK275]|nr:hypothetical protein [Rhizobium sp. BK275]
MIGMIGGNTKAQLAALASLKANVMVADSKQWRLRPCTPHPSTRLPS